MPPGASALTGPKVTQGCNAPSNTSCGTASSRPQGSSVACPAGSDLNSLGYVLEFPNHCGQVPQWRRGGNTSSLCFGHAKHCPNKNKYPSHYLTQFLLVVPLLQSHPNSSSPPTVAVLFLDSSKAVHSSVCVVQSSTSCSSSVTAPSVAASKCLNSSC